MSVTLGAAMAAAVGLPPPDQPLTYGDPAKHFALVIGIGRYREYPPLNSPGQDAVRFCEWLVTKAGVPPENIRPVIGERDGVPTNDDIIAAMVKLGLRGKQWQGSRLYIYYAGHGVGPDLSEVALLPANAMIDGLQGEVFGVVKLLNHFAKTCMFDEVVAFLDCCRDQVEVQVRPLPWAADGPVVNPRDPMPDFNYYSLVGSGFSGKSFELLRAPEAVEATYRGLMTEALLEGLNGAPGAVDPDQPDRITTASLQRFVVEHVAKAASDNKLKQQVDPLFGTSTPIVLCQLAGPPEMTINITIGPQCANQPIRIQSARDFQIREVGNGPEGTSLSVRIAAGSRHQLLAGTYSTMLDPSQLKDHHDLQLP